MRTTLTIDDNLLKQLKQLSLETGKPFKQVVNETLLAGLSSKADVKRKTYRLSTVDLGTTKPGRDLNKALRLAEELEDEALMEKMDQRK